MSTQPMFYGPPAGPPGGSDSGAMIALVVVIFLIISSVSLLIYFFMNRKKEGDVCKGTDVNAVYKYNKDKKCLIDTCNTGFAFSKATESCVPSLEGDTCIGSDPNGMYKNGKDNTCDFVECKTGYVLVDGTCTAPTASPLASETMYDRNILNIAVTGYTGTQYPYSDEAACNARCLDDETCDGVSFTDTVNSSVNDNACWKLVRNPDEEVTYGTHDHYSASIKAPVLVYENPTFTGKNTVDVTGTPWSADGWDTFMSSTAHGKLYLSWHPFSHDTAKMWASWTSADEYVGIKYPKKVILKMYIINSTSDRNNYTPGSVVVEGSNDGTAWAPLKTTTTPADNVGYGKNRTRTIAYEDMSSNTTPYMYYRARISSGGKYNNISDFKLFTTLP